MHNYSEYLGRIQGDIAMVSLLVVPQIRKQICACLSLGYGNTVDIRMRPQSGTHGATQTPSIYTMKVEKNDRPIQIMPTTCNWPSTACREGASLPISLNTPRFSTPSNTTT